MGFFSFLNKKKVPTQAPEAPVVETPSAAKKEPVKPVPASKRASLKQKTQSTLKKVASSVTTVTSQAKTSPSYKKGLLPKAEFDFTVKPSDDFNLYANGGFLANNPIPDDQQSWGTFAILANETEKKLHGLVNEASTWADDDAVRVSGVWTVAMDVNMCNEQKFDPVKPLLAKISAAADVNELSAVVAELHQLSIEVFFTLDFEEDLKNSEIVVPYISQAGLGLPDRDYYVLDDKAEMRQKYKAYMEQLFTLAGHDNASELVAKVFAVEEHLATNSLTKTEARDLQKMYNPETYETMCEAMAPFSLDVYAKATGLFSAYHDAEEKGPFVNGTVEYLKGGLKTVFDTFSMEDIKLYLTFHVLNSSAKYLHDEASELFFQFYVKEVIGQKERDPRWKEVLKFLNTVYGEGQILGRLYCKKYFPESDKAAMLELVEELRVALGQSIEALDWMDTETKKQAAKKLEAFKVKIGYPDEYKDVSDLELHTTSYWANVAAAHRHKFKQQLAKCNRPSDVHEWFMPPQMINAYFHPMKNEIVFPAAILQYPFFSVESDPALNFGAIGAVIGHEMSHGYDDQGRQFNFEGNMVNWWTEQDSKNFDERAQVIIDQFDKFELVGQHVNGKLTQGENIADIGGAKIAFKAMQNHFAKHGRQPDIDGFTAEQRFFISYARNWRVNSREEQQKLRLATDPHSPPQFRILGPLRNLPEFHEAFDVKEGDNMYLPEAERVAIW